MVITSKTDISTLVIKNLILIPSGIGLKNLFLVKNTVFNNVNSGHFYKYAIYKFFTQKTIKKRFNTTPYIIHNHWSSGYHHWITESLIRLISIDNYQNKTLLLPDNYPVFTYDSLKLLGVNTIHKFSVKANLKLESLEIPEHPNSGHYDRSQLLSLKQLLLKYSIPSNIPFIYITRKNAAKRKIENEDELVPILKKYNFKIIDADNLTIKEQISLFSSCKVLISIHGAALTNCLFMNEKTNLVELYKSNAFINHCYERMTHQLNIHFTRLLCGGGVNANTHVDVTHLVVNIEEFENTLKKLK